MPCQVAIEARKSICKQLPRLAPPLRGLRSSKGSTVQGQPMAHRRQMRSRPRISSLSGTGTVLPLLIVNGPCLDVEYFIYFLRFHLLCCVSPSPISQFIFARLRMASLKMILMLPRKEWRGRERRGFGGNPLLLPILLLPPNGDSV